MNRNSAIVYALFFLIADLVIVWYLAVFVVNSTNYIAKSIAIMAIVDVIAFTLSGCFSIYILFIGKSKIWMKKLVTIAFIIFMFFGGAIFSSFSLLVNNIFSGISAILAIFACLAVGLSCFIYTYQFTVFALKKKSENQLPKSPKLDRVNSLSFAVAALIMGGLMSVNSIRFWLFGSEATFFVINNNLDAAFALGCSLIVLFGSYKYFTEKDGNANNSHWNSWLSILLGIWTLIDGGYLIIIESNSSELNLGIKFLFCGILMLTVGLNSIIRSRNSSKTETRSIE